MIILPALPPLDCTLCLTFHDDRDTSQTQFEGNVVLDLLELNVEAQAMDRLNKRQVLFWREHRR